MTLETIVTISLILLSIIAIVCVFCRLVKCSIALVVGIIIVRLLFVICWGDGTTYVNQVSALLPDDKAEILVDAYEAHRDVEAGEQIVDYDAVAGVTSSVVTNIFNYVGDALNREDLS